MSFGVQSTSKRWTVFIFLLACWLGERGKETQNQFPPDQLPLAEFKRWSGGGWGLEGFHLIYEDSWIYSQITKFPRFFAVVFLCLQLTSEDIGCISWLEAIASWACSSWISFIGSSSCMCLLPCWQQIFDLPLKKQFLDLSSWLAAVTGFVFFICSSSWICLFDWQQFLYVSPGLQQSWISLADGQFSHCLAAVPLFSPLWLAAVPAFSSLWMAAFSSFS